MSAADLKAVATGKASEGKNPVAAFSTFLDRFKPQMALALPKHLNADRMARLAVTAFSTTPALQNCNPQSIVGAIMTASILGLEINVNGQGYLIPYKGSCQFVPGWKGLTDLAQRSGRCSVWTGAVFEGDQFEYAMGDSPYVRHVPGDEDDWSKLTHVYAIGRINGSQWPVVEVWTISKIWKHRDKFNKVGKMHYSYANPEMYARKIPLLQVLKYMPQSIEMSNAMAMNDAYETGRNQTLDGAQFINDLGPLGDDAPANTEDPAPANTAAASTKPEASSEYTKVFNQIFRAKSIDTLDVAVDLIRGIADSTEQEKLRQLAADKRAELSA